MLYQLSYSRVATMLGAWVDERQRASAFSDRGWAIFKK